MFDGRIYRAAFVPLLFVLVIVAFSLASVSAPMSSTLAPDAFDGARAYAQLQLLAKCFPERSPGSPGDTAFAAYIERQLRGLGGSPVSGRASSECSPASNQAANAANEQLAGTAPTGAAGGGFKVSSREVRAATIDGEQTLTTVVAVRPGSTGRSPIVILAHRDAAARGSVAELSGTAVLLELARVFSQSETRRTIVLVSSSGGTGGGSVEADDVPGHESQPPDAAIVLGDLAGSVARRPFVLPFSNSSAMAPENLLRTLDGAISQEVGADPGTVGFATQLAHFAVPLATGEEASLNAEGVPTVLVQVSGERGPVAGEIVNSTRMLNFGRAVLSAIYALDEGPDVTHKADTQLLLGHKLLPAWAVRLLGLGLLLPLLLVCIDALARLRRRKEPVLRWLAWTLVCALPFCACALFALLLGASGIVAEPAGQPPAGALSADASASGATVAVGLVLVLALLAWPALMRRRGLPPRPTADGAALGVLLVALALALLVWVFNPIASLLLIFPLHSWLFAVGPARRGDPRARLLAYGAILLGALPLVLLIAIYAHDLGLGAGGLLESVVVALVGGQVGLVGALLWSVALGCLLGVLSIAPPREEIVGAGPHEWSEIATRGPASYAGPGSLGGTQSALRR